MGVAGGDASLIKFANETINRKRGYGKQVGLDINVSGTITHNVVNIDSLDLPLKVRKQIREAMRHTKQIESKVV